MLNQDVFELLTAGREARGYALRCQRVLRNGINEEDTLAFSELGQDFIDYSAVSIRNLRTLLINTAIGSGLATVIEDRWLATSKGPYEEHGKDLREAGITNLLEFGEILKKAKTPRFKKYIPALISFFNGYNSWADELLALAEQSKEKDFCYQLPPTRLEIALGADN